MKQIGCLFRFEFIVTLMKKLVLFLILLCLWPVWAGATTYYVANAGNDSCNGTSSSLGKSGACAWQTIAHVNAHKFNPGDSILFQSGGTWREQLTVPSSGSSGNPITFGSYGSGAQPIINGSTSSYSINLNGKSYITVQNLDLVNANLYGVYGAKVNNIILNGLTIYNSYEAGIWFLETSTNCTIENSTISHSGGNGISLGSGSENILIQGNQVYNNCQLSTDAINQNFTAGIKMNASTSINVIIENNNVYYNGTNSGGSPVNTGDRGYGIWLDQSNLTGGHTVRYNSVHNNNVSGIRLENNTGKVSVYYNLVYGNLADGIQLSNTIQSCTVYNNTAYGNSGRGIWVAGTGSASEMLNNTVKNNMSEGNGGNQLQAIYGGENDGTMGSGNVYTYNDFGAQATNFIVWGAIKYKSTYSAWETVYCGTTGCSHSVQSNPFFVSTSIPNFQLEAGSPAIYAGVNVGLTTDYARNSVHNPPSIGAYEYGEETVPGPPGNLRLGGQ